MWSAVLGAFEAEGLSEILEVNLAILLRAAFLLYGPRAGSPRCSVD